MPTLSDFNDYLIMFKINICRQNIFSRQTKSLETDEYDYPAIQKRLKYDCTHLKNTENRMCFIAQLVWVCTRMLEQSRCSPLELNKNRNAR